MTSAIETNEKTIAQMIADARSLAAATAMLSQIPKPQLGPLVPGIFLFWNQEPLVSQFACKACKPS